MTVRTIAAFVIAVVGFNRPAISQTTISCDDLVHFQVPTTAIALPVGRITITSSTHIDAAAAELQPNGAMTPQMPEYCRVVGRIDSVDPSAPAINFEVNLPTAWNGKSVQYGGGGFNGTLVTGLAPLRDAPPDVPVPLMQGYVTLGTDSGHQEAALPEPQAFALNNEALVNFAYASYKKVHDVAVALMKQAYGRAPTRTYFFGGSEGGREGLTMAQRFPADYDGIVSAVPVISWTALQAAGNRGGIAQQNGGFLDPAHLALLKRAVVLQCDALDGLKDGIISNYLGCRDVFKAEPLTCAANQPPNESCLSAAQIRAVNTLHSPFKFPFALANGVTSYPGYPYGGEDQPGGALQWLGTKPASSTPGVAQGLGQQWVFGSGAVRYFIARDAHYDSLRYTPEAFRGRTQEISALMDSTNPDLSAFANRGGKLIIKENLSDYAQSPYAGIAYYQAVVQKMGRPRAGSFLRLYVTPGANHGGAGVLANGEPLPQFIDLLSVLDTWTDKNQPPADVLTQVAKTNRPPFTVTSSRPMCQYPLFPKYDGKGDSNLASSFRCGNHQGPADVHRSR